MTETGSGRLQPTPGALWLTVRPEQHAYSNAQITDYSYSGFNFRWTPPLRLTVTARFAGAPPLGTAGFGFWNHPFSPDAHHLPRLPQAIWFFFASPPGDMAFAYGVPGCGWKAATLDMRPAAALLLAPLALPAALLMRNARLYAKLWPGLQRQLKIGEYALPGELLAERHTYALEWRHDGATFAVDGAPVYTTPFAPRGPAGLIAWMDNRYLIATPQGALRFGVVPIASEQALVLESLVIERL